MPDDVTTLSAELTEGVAVQFLASAPFSLVITDPRQQDNPIVYANQAFYRSSGYAKDEVIGRNCRFLQGPGTDPAAIRKIHKALDAGQEVLVDILNYKRDGTPFWNRLMIGPLKSPSGEVLYFSGVQKVLGPEDAPDRANVAIEELHHRVKNHLSMVVSLIRMHGRFDKRRPKEILDMAARRVEGLGLLYEQLSTRGGENTHAVVLGDYLGRVCDAIAGIAGQSAIRMRTRADRFTVSIDVALPLGLIVSEIVTNALQHAFTDGKGGSVITSIEEMRDHGIHIVIRDDGRGFDVDTDWPSDNSLGGKLIAQLSASLQAELKVNSDASGTTFDIVVPPSARNL